MSTLPESNEKIIEKKKDFKFYLKEAFFSFVWLAILLLIGDIVTKVVAMQYLKEGVSVPFIPGLLKWTLTYNKGAAWGMGGDATWSRILLILISWGAMIGILWYFIAKYKTLNKFMKACLMIILAGDVGNLIDRTFFYNRGVVDFLDITELIPNFGIFNFADSCLVVGLLMLVVYFIVEWIKELVTEAKANRHSKDGNDNESGK